MSDDEQRPKRTLEILLGTGGIGVVLSGIAAVLVLLQPQSRPDPESPEPRPTQLVVVTVPPDPSPAPTERETAAVTPSERTAPTPVPPEPTVPPTPPPAVPTGVAEVEYSILLSPYRPGQYSVTATVAIDGQRVGTLHIQPGTEMSLLKLAAAVGFHSYDVVLDKVEDLGLGPQQFRVTGSGQVYVTPGIRFVVGDDGFSASLQPG